MNTVKTGKQTQITAKVREVADSINGEGLTAVKEIADYIKLMDVVENSKVPDFTKTADEILKEDKYDGCNEAGLVFAALLRAKGIPTTYIQALNKDAVRNYSRAKPSLNGHVFLEANFGNRTKKIINSTTGEITNTLPQNMIMGARGLDSWDIGLRNSFSDLQKIFEKKHNKWL